MIKASTKKLKTAAMSKLIKLGLKDMWIILLFTLILFSNCSVAQSNKLLQNKKYFDTALNQWTKTYTNFNLTNFKITDTLHFENIDDEDFENYKTFLSIYKPIITYSPDSSQFIDIYSYELNLEKEGNHYVTYGEIDQAIYLCNKEKKYWKRINFFTTSSQWIEEIIWVSKYEFILTGVTINKEGKRLPLILFGDTKKQTFLKFETINENCFQNKRYSSPKLKKIKIVGL